MPGDQDQNQRSTLNRRSSDFEPHRNHLSIKRRIQESIGTLQQELGDQDQSQRSRLHRSGSDFE